MNQDRIDDLRKMLEQVDAASVSSRTSGETLESVLEGVAGKESLEFARGTAVAEQELEFAQEALDVFVQGEEIDADQQFMLEAIVMPFKRPVVDVVQNKMVETQLTSDWKSLVTDPNKRSVIESAVLSIGRIEVPNHVQLPYAGTGFVVGPDLIMTNRHVANIFAMGVGERNLTFIPGQVSQIDFFQELDNPASEVLQVVDIKMIHPHWDMALLQVSGLSPTRRPLKLSHVDPASRFDAEVVTIGYPGFDPRPDREFQRIQSRIFRDVYYVKRLQPGHLRTHQVIDSFGHDVRAITHDCSTLGGNSGSAVIDLQSGHVIGLHFAGAYLKANFAVPSNELVADRQVIDAGVESAGEAGSGASLPKPPSSPGAAEPTDGRPLNVAGEMNQSPAVGHGRRAGAAGSAREWTIPLKITIDIGNALPADGGQAIEVGATVARGVPVVRQLEGLFGPAAKDFSLTEMAELFSAKSLTKKPFQMSTALSSAIASKFVYESGAVIEPFGVGRFGFETCKFIEASDTQCFIASTKKAVLVCFRGTESIGDWLLNLRALTTRRPYGDVHTGFLRGLEFVQIQLESELEKLPNRKLLICGHSLGGAIGTVAAAEWVGRFDVAGVYTFGQPGVGRRGFAAFMNQHYQGKFFRFVNNSDVVTRVPPGYEHVGKLFHFDSRGRIKAATESLETHSATANDTTMMSDAAFAALQAQLAELARGPQVESMAVEESVFTSISDHGMDRYIEKILKNS